MKWRYFDKAWKDRKDWQEEVKAQFYKGWLRYKDRATPAFAAPDSLSKADKHICDELSDGEDTIEEVDHLAQYLAEPVGRELSSKDSPVRYWLGQASRWPQLTSMALDIYSMPVMSDEPEWIFSTAGDTLSPRRRRLNSDTTGHLMCLKSWQKQGLIQLDRSLFERAVLAVSSSDS